MNSVLLITGGSRGIGAATALLAARKGYAVAVNYRQNAATARQVVSAIQASCGQAVAIQADVSSESDVERIFREVAQHYRAGEQRGHSGAADPRGTSGRRPTETHF